MTEYIRELRYSIYIDTNKQTIDETFGSLEALLNRVQELVDDGLPTAGYNGGREVREGVMGAGARSGPPQANSRRYHDCKGGSDRNPRELAPIHALKSELSPDSTTRNTK